jgi:hypothetical protein
MQFSPLHRLIRPLVAGTAPVLLAVSVALASAPSGAIFTTDSTGTQVNGNIYADKSAVFLNGGPQNANCSAAGLTDGHYYFQVTDPSGSTLLSNLDDITQREVIVAGGVVTSYVVPATGAHTTNPGPCSSTAVGLAPFSDTGNAGGEYKAWMTPVGAYDRINLSGFFGFSAKESKTDNFKLNASPTPPPSSTITGLKFYDTNANGVQDGLEPGIPGWHIEKVPGAPDVTYTDSSGLYQYLAINDSTKYTISELPPVGWFPVGVWENTTPTSGTATANALNVPGPNFGNVCLGAGGGLTLGYWSNKNGQALITGTDLAFLRGLNLRNATGANFDPPTNAALRTWLLSATATNMAYMLSAQLTAMELNVTNTSNVSAAALIYAPGTTSANSAGFASVGAIMSEANTELGAHASALSGSPYRSYQEALKNALDRANNNLTFIQTPVGDTIPCAVESPYVP